MATATHTLSLEEFRSRYRQRKPYFEYLFGEPIGKTKSTWLHAVLLTTNHITEAFIDDTGNVVNFANASAGRRAIEL